MKRRKAVYILLLIFCLLLTGCGARGEKTAQLVDYGRGTRTLGDCVSGDWGEKFVRSNGYTYPFVFDEPICQCVGFTLEYQITEVTEGSLSGNFRYEVYVRLTNGNWKSVELFQMDGDTATVEIQLEKMMDIDAVAVVCQKKGNVSFSYNIGVYNAQYT